MRDSREQWMKQRQALQTTEGEMMMKELIFVIEQDLLELKVKFLMEKMTTLKDPKDIGDGTLAMASMCGRPIFKNLKKILGNAIEVIPGRGIQTMMPEPWRLMLTTLAGSVWPSSAKISITASKFHRRCFHPVLLQHHHQRLFWRQL